MGEQGISHELAGSGSGQNHIEILLCDNLVDKLLNLILVLFDLSAGLLPGRRLLINLLYRPV